ncbi:MAG TPA: cysteine desulfurase family protein [Planctomycetota bacterium]|nr:cysteine desulfurase family protein [Planctomycetota bacterium]
MARLYLDHNASCPLRAEARAAIVDVLDDGQLGNPSSAHADGRRARARLESAREELARVLDCGRDEVLFTSGGTESNALALSAAPPDRAVLHAPIEHPSLLVPLAARPGAVALAVDGEGRVDPDEPARHAALRPALLTVALANHELGVVQDIRRLAAGARSAGMLVHCDASQAAGRLPLSFRELGVDLMTVSAHKLGGPVGIGALIARSGAPLRALLRGGEQEAGLRAGTEAVALAAGFAAAAAAAWRELPQAAPRWLAWCLQLRERIARMEPDATFNSPARGGLPNTLNVSFPGRPGSSLVHRLDLEEVSVSHGSACASGSLKPSPVLLACGAGEDRARGALRISVGPVNRPEDLVEFGVRLARVLSAVPPRALT